jgi:hypothetical protein
MLICATFRASVRRFGVNPWCSNKDSAPVGAIAEAMLRSVRLVRRSLAIALPSKKMRGAEQLNGALKLMGEPCCSR